MAELLPECWGADEPESHCCSNQLSKPSRRGPVKDILVWLDCYASLVSVLCSAHPLKFHHFMDYQRTIIRAHRMFVGDRWVVYDACYRRSAANKKSLDWGIKDTDLYNEHSRGELEQSPAAASVGVSYTQLQNVIKLTHTGHPLAREDIFAHSGQMTQFVFYTTTGMETGAPSRLVNMVTSARNVGAGIQSLTVQSKSGHILPPNKDQEGRTDSP